MKHTSIEAFWKKTSRIENTGTPPTTDNEKMNKNRARKNYGGRMIFGTEASTSF
ncbi:MAG: hypothetical protein QCI82_01105 [Candidatus Thermoplasmatota archaeon]|nr:hypothetical protein [Candidatus Thermoplasmatota archaeon]